MEQQSTFRQPGKTRVRPQPSRDSYPRYALDLAPILLEQLEYLIEHANEEGDRYKRVASILMERFQ